MDRLSTENRNWFKRNLIPLIVGALAGGVAVDLIHRFTGLFG